MNSLNITVWKSQLETYLFEKTRQGKGLYQNTKFCNNKQKTEGENNKVRFKESSESDMSAGNAYLLRLWKRRKQRHES